MVFTRVLSVGEQYQKHNPLPGPVYAGGGYAPVIEALHDAEKLREMFSTSPNPRALANEVTTGGARPLHSCGMSRTAQLATEFLISQGGEIDALDTYGMTPLMRMASNNLPIGAEALLKYGADPKGAKKMAVSSAADDVIKVLADYPILRVSGSVKDASVNGVYLCRGSQLFPDAFEKVCNENGWKPDEMWKQLNEGRKWWKHTKNDSYIYKHQDGKYWIDGPDGLARHIATELDAFDGVTVSVLQ